VPIVKISAQLNAAILTNVTRSVKHSDAADIEILSTYLPYMDMFCTDAFMVEQLRSLKLDRTYGVELFSARNASLGDLKMRIEKYLEKTSPAHRPSITVFVVPSEDLKGKSFEFFRKLGASASELGVNEYAEIYAFDDGHMPQYRLSQLPNVPAPFYGLQTVQTIAMTPGMTTEAILKACREHCRSDKFVLVNEYKELPSHFLLGAVMSAESGSGLASGYRIYNTVA
jgi:hypothetical protein